MFYKRIDTNTHWMFMYFEVFTCMCGFVVSCCILAFMESRSYKSFSITFSPNFFKVILCIWVHVGYLHTHYKRASDPITNGYELRCGCWELNLGPLEDQPVLLTTETFLQPCLPCSYRLICELSFWCYYLSAMTLLTWWSWILILWYPKP